MNACFSPFLAHNSKTLKSITNFLLWFGTLLLNFIEINLLILKLLHEYQVYTNENDDTDKEYNTDDDDNYSTIPI